MMQRLVWALGSCCGHKLSLKLELHNHCTYQITLPCYLCLILACFLRDLFLCVCACCCETPYKFSDWNTHWGFEKDVSILVSSVRHSVCVPIYWQNVPIRMLCMWYIRRHKLIGSHTNRIQTGNIRSDTALQRTKRAGTQIESPRLEKLSNFQH